MDDLPQIIIRGIIFTEPVTFFTDLLVSVVSIVFMFKLFNKAKASSRHNYRLMFFAFMGLSALAGGVYHLLIYYVSENLALAAWIVSVFGVFMLEMWSLTFLQRTKLLTFMAVLSSFMLFVSVIAILITESFFPVVLRSVAGVYGIVITVRLQVKNSLPQRIFRHFFYGVAFSTLSGIAFIPALSIHPWFNNADFGHVLLAVAIIFYYKGAVAEIRSGY